MSFWQNVENELLYKNMSREELAEKASFAVSGISLGLSHDSIPYADVAVRIANVLDVSVEYLITGQDSHTIPKEETAIIQHINSDLQKLDKYDLESVLLMINRLAQKQTANSS